MLRQARVWVDLCISRLLGCECQNRRQVFVIGLYILYAKPLKGRISILSRIGEATHHALGALGGL